MIEFLRRMFAPERSSETAKERLKLVLLSDHLSLAPDVVAALKRDLLEVISRYVEIDPAHADVTFEQRDREVAMLASIPITGMRERGGLPATNGSGRAREIASEPVPPLATAVAPDVASAAAGGPARIDRDGSDEREQELPDQIEIEPTTDVVAEVEGDVPHPSLAPMLSHDASVPLVPMPAPVRRRKRRRKAAASVPHSAPVHGSPGFDPA